jgi:ornithine decarboxylase
MTSDEAPVFRDTGAMLAALRPAEPVYCVHPSVYREAAQRFLEGFPGRVLYAVKANDAPEVLASLHESGIEHFDCASLTEIERVKSIAPNAHCYLMTPVRLPGSARRAQQDHGVRHFLIDHASGLAPLLDEIEVAESIVFVRMAVSHPSAVENLSSKFGAPPPDVPGLLRAVADCGAEPALAFNVGSGVRSPDAYAHGIDVACDALAGFGRSVRLVDIGGGFPHTYPGFEAPPLDAYFDVIESAASALPLAEGGEILAEPGRALAAGGLSAVVRVLLRKNDRLYLSDGIYGAFWELRFDGHKQYPVRAFRGSEQLEGDLRSFSLYGPTCDSNDVFPEPVMLPSAVDVGDHLEFTSIGAYSLSGRTGFNGFAGHAIVSLESTR